MDLHVRVLRGSETSDDGNGDDGEPHFDYLGWYTMKLR
jgi:hypothetical protein